MAVTEGLEPPSARSIRLRFLGRSAIYSHVTCFTLKMPFPFALCRPVQAFSWLTLVKAQRMLSALRAGFRTFRSQTDSPLSLESYVTKNHTEHVSVILVATGGLEPPASPLSGVRSNQLSYAAVNCCCLLQPPLRECGTVDGPRTRSEHDAPRLERPVTLPICPPQYHLVGVTGLEPVTPWSQTRCATKLRHTPRISFELLKSLFAMPSWIITPDSPV